MRSADLQPGHIPSLVRCHRGRNHDGVGHFGDRVTVRCARLAGYYACGDYRPVLLAELWREEILRLSSPTRIVLAQDRSLTGVRNIADTSYGWRPRFGRLPCHGEGVGDE
jgi:hypothetical protein